MKSTSLTTNRLDKLDSNTDDNAENEHHTTVKMIRRQFYIQ